LKKAALYILLPLLILLLALCIGVYWLVETAGGARFAISTAAGAAGYSIAMSDVQGRLMDRLQINGVRLWKPKYKAEIDRLRLDWELGSVFGGDLLVRELTLSGVRVQDDTPPSGKPPLRLPRLPAFLTRYSAEISKLKLERVSYRRRSSAPVLISELSSPVLLKSGVLSLSNIKLVAAQGRASGAIDLGLYHPSLRIDLAAVPNRPLQGIDLFSLQARLLAGRAPEQVAGPIAIAGRGGGAQRLELTGELGVTERRLNLRRLALLRPGQGGIVTGAGSITLAPKDTLFNLALNLKNLDLQQELKRKTDLSGSFNISGSTAKFQGSFSLANRGAGWENGSLAGQYQGDQAGVRLAPLKGRLLDGTLAGALELAWKEGVRLRGTLAGRGLDPARVAADWSGRVNFNLAAALELPKQGGPRGELRGTLLESRLHGQELNGAVDASFAGKRVRVARLFLQGRGFDLHGAGELDRRLDLVAKVSDLSRLVPNAAGELEANAWVRWRDNLLSGAANARGRGIAVGSLRTAALQLQGSLGEGKEHPVRLQGALQQVRAGRLRVDSATLALDGSAARHTLNAELASGGSAAALTLAGGYQAGVWGGAIRSFSGPYQVGPWSLAAPAPLSFSKGGFRLAPLQVNGAPGERLDLAGAMTFHPRAGSFRGSWSGLNLARANSWLDRVLLTGASAGNLDLRLLPGERVVVAGGADAHGTVAVDGRLYTLDQLTASLNGDQSGLRLTVDLSVQGGEGEGHLRFTSSAPASLSMPRQGDLKLQLANLDLALLRPFTPSDLKLQGRAAGVVNGALTAGGRIDVSGSAFLSNGRAQWRRDDQSFDAAFETAELAFGWRGRVGSGKTEAGTLTLNGRALATGIYSARGERITASRCTLRVEADQRGTRAGLELSLERQGGVTASFRSDTPASLAIPRQGELRLQLADLDLALLQPLLASGTAVTGRLSGSANGKLAPGGRIDLNGSALVRDGEARWQNNGESLAALLETAEVSFGWDGRAAAGKPTPGSLRLNARASATGSYSGKGGRIDIKRCTLGIDADQRGTRAALDLSVDGGVFRAGLSSDSPAALALPETGQLTMQWGGMDPALLKPWLPGALNLHGAFAGNASGRLLPGKRVELAGEAEFSQGRANWQGQRGEMNANVKSARASFAWRGETLSGALSLALAQSGQGQGSFVFPIPARLPITPNRNAPVSGGFTGKLQERGFLTALFPGLVQESHGLLDVDLRLGGVWRDPDLTGSLRLSQAGAYLPSAGITISNVQLAARLQGEQISIDDFRVRSGKGEVSGKMQLQLDGWHLARFSGTLNGKDFQTVYLPELQLVTSPRLTLTGEKDRVTVNGDLLVPEMLVSGPPVRAITSPSKDVVFEGAPPQNLASGKSAILVEGQIHVVLGDKVQVKSHGIDAKLGGGIDLILNGINNIASRGEIRVVKGSYKAYGVDLDIVRGRLYYTGESVDQPNLDILALRTVADVKAGVTVAGRLNAPVVKLYSEPTMPDVDILAYMVLGHPLASGEQGSMVAMAASSLLSMGQSDSLQEQIKERLGLSVLGLETVTPSTSGLMGYKEVQVTPSGAAPAKAPAAESLLTVGKYLTPKLYLSYGRSLVTGGSLFLLRYDILRHWQLETQSGSESGADIYYKLEFD
jgi:autotransporter translocation and assembly factor TamB